MFEALIQQITNTSAADLTALIVAITTAVGTIGALVVGISAKIKASTHDARISKVADDMNTVGQLATAFSQKTAEQQDDLKTIADVITNLSPDAKKLLDEQQKSMEYWKDRANTADQQLKRLLPLVPAEGQANAIKDLPREKEKNLSAVNRI